MESYDEIKLGIAKELNSAIMNNSLKKILRNDLEIAPAYDYTPNIWENRWFNDAVIPGYDRGYCVWRNVYTNISSFLDSYGDIVWDYAKNNDILKSVILSTWTDVKACKYDATRQAWIDRYCNAISGYAVKTTTGIKITDKLRYIKLEIIRNNSDSAGVAISELNFFDALNAKLHYPGTMRFSYDNMDVFDGAKADKLFDETDSDRTKTNFRCRFIDINKPMSVTVDFGRPFLDLLKYKKWSWNAAYKTEELSEYDYCGMREFNLYGSVNGEDWALLDQARKIANPPPEKSGYEFYRQNVNLRNMSVYKQVLDPMFDYGPRLGPPDMRIELYVSTKYDNKELLSNRTAWNYIVLSSQEQYDAFISTEIDMIFDSHMRDYHLNGKLLRTEINDVLLKKDFSNFNIGNVQNQILFKGHDYYIDNSGFDYVVDFKKYRTEESNGLYKYQWYRLWNSGWLEHGGTIPCYKTLAKHDIRSYYVKVDLTWGGNNAIVYDYPMVSGDYYGNAYANMYYGSIDGDIAQKAEERLDSSRLHIADNGYSIHVTPIQFDYEQDLLEDGKFAPFAELKKRDYPEKSLNNKNSPFVTTEVHHVANDSFCFTKSNTDQLASDVIQYYSYYTSGYTVAPRQAKST